MSAALARDWAPHSNASAVAYGRSLLAAYNAGLAAAAHPLPRCIYANPAHVQTWRQGLADGLRAQPAGTAA